MGGLEHHFGENASLDPASQADILRFLEANAADSGNSRMGANVAPLRISKTSWFERKHDEGARAVWSRKAVGSAANCAACHRQAAQGGSMNTTSGFPSKRAQSMRILVVEDDRMLGDGLQAGLTQAGYAVDWLRDGEAAVAALSTEHFAAVVLDLGLPKRDGLSVLQWLRARHDATPVLILTARDQLEDKVRGLDLGADDYVLKPFDLDEIAARLRALVRRAQGRPEPLLSLGEVKFDPARAA